MKQRLATFRVEINLEDGAGLNEKGWHVLVDALRDADIESALEMAAYNALTSALPRNFPYEAWSVTAEEVG